MSYFEPKKEKKEKSFIDSSQVGISMVDDSMASFDLGDKTSKFKSARKQGTSMFSKSKNDEKKSKIKSYQ